MNKTKNIEYGLLNSTIQSHIYPDIYPPPFTLSAATVASTTPSVFLEVQEGTMQVPIGLYSILSDMMEGSVKAFDTMVDLCYNCFSNWDLGLSHSKSIRNVGKLFSVSHQYVQQSSKRLIDMSRLKRVSGKHKISKFEMTHYSCDPEYIPLDKDGRPLKCAMPRGHGGLFERLASGDIHWKAGLIWILLKVNSDWTTGITNPTSIKVLRQWTRFGTSDICKYLKQLESAGMLKRLPRRPHEATVYQLYPKPPEKRSERQPEQKVTWRDMRVEGNWRYSFNEQWRVNVETLDIQRRSSKKELFRATSDNEKYVLMPKSMREDFDMACRVHNKLNLELRE